MPVIDPQGLFDGERLAACSDKAKLYWPYIYCASNGWSRMEVNPRAIRQRCFASFSEPPNDETILDVLREYAENYLLIFYEHQGRPWIQFDTAEKYLPRHKSKRDKESPQPPPDTLSDFQKGYIEWKRAKSLCLQHARKISEISETFRKNARGIGIGIGTGVGVGEGIGVGDGSDLSLTLEEQEHEQENAEMNAVKGITLQTQMIFHTNADMSEMNKLQVQALEAEHKGSAVVNAFKTWAYQHRHDEIRKPVAAFLRVAEDLLGAPAYTPAPATPAVQSAALSVGREIAYLTNNQVSLNLDQKNALGALMGEEGYSADEVVAGFKQFYATQDLDNTKSLPYVGKNFVERAGDLLNTIRRRRQEQEKEQLAVDAARVRLEQEAVREMDELRKKREEEAAMVEDELTAD